MTSKIYTHNEAAELIDIFEIFLEDHGVKIKVPSPEDSERGEDNEAVLYGSVYDELIDCVEDRLIHICEEVENGTPYVMYKNV